MTNLPTKEMKMTVKEVAEVLKVHRNTIINSVNEVYPNLMVNGITTYLSLEQVTAVKINLTKKYKVADIKTSLEKTMLIKQAMQFLIEDVEVLKSENIQLKEQKMIDAPKVEFYKAVTESKDTIDIGAVAKLLNKKIGRNKLFEVLRNKRVLQRNNIPYQSFIDRGYFRLIESKFNKPDGSTHINLKTVVFQKGIEFINKMVE